MSDSLLILARAAEMAARNPKAAARLREHVALLERCPEERRPVVAAALAEVYREMSVLVEPSLRYRLLEGGPYPNAPRLVRARLILGESPAVISGGLSRAEAHRWLTSFGALSSSPSPVGRSLRSWSSVAVREDACDWLLGQHDLADYRCHDIAVARWLIVCNRDPQRRATLWRHREERGPHGEIVVGAFIRRVDELRRSDLRPSVEETFRRAGVRLMRSVTRAMAKKSEPLNVAPRWWRGARCARLLLSAAELAAEGKIMSHCVGAYVPYVRSGKSVIVSLTVCGHRSTVELDRATCVVRQHRGPRNCEPHELCDRALRVLLQRWRAIDAWSVLKHVC